MLAAALQALAWHRTECVALALQPPSLYCSALLDLVQCSTGLGTRCVRVHVGKD